MKLDFDVLFISQSYFKRQIFQNCVLRLTESWHKDHDLLSG